VVTAVEQTGSSAALEGDWAGDVVADDGTVTAYVTQAGEPALAAALASAVGSPSAGYKIVTVPRSLIDLQALTDKITADLPQLTSQGVAIAQYGLDAASDTVGIELSDYTPDTAQALADRYGADAISVRPASDPGMTFSPASRNFDTRPPWFNGDPLFYNGNHNDLCTLGFGFRGNKSGHLFNATAGHFGPDGIG
jgi:hypothetical protein